MRKILRRLFLMVVFFTLVRILFYAVNLLSTQSSLETFLNKDYIKVYSNYTFSWLMEEQELHPAINNSEAPMRSSAPESVQEGAQMPTAADEIIGPCPDTPPNLVGPLRVEFNKTRTLDWVGEQVGSLLQIGGRFKPLHCVAQQKVGE